MNFQRFDKQACFERAQNLFKSGDDSLLRYVCLELRFCIEAIVYDKLRLYANRLPPTVIATWQPPQAMKALLRIEPEANENKSVAMCPEDSEGNPTGNWLHVGMHRTVPVSWISKTYNKLGNFLHVPNPRAEELRPLPVSMEKLRRELNAILTELKPVVETSFDASFAEVVTFPCEICNSLVPCNAKGLRQTHEAECLNPHCGVRFVAVENDNGSFSFTLQTAVFPCQKCKNEIPIADKKVKVGMDFTCSACRTKHVIHSQAWHFYSPEIQRQNDSTESAILNEE